ncbi:MAG: hypothetical protein JXQ96_07110 [Cyclobacteriaceae bacterium]
MKHQKRTIMEWVRLLCFGITLLILLSLLKSGLAFGQLSVNFDQKLRDWDGFGINYVETCNLRDFDKYLETPQEYGGLSTLSEAKRKEILDLIFSSDGLRPGLVKMFLDPFHEREKGQYDHETTTQWMRYFVHEGLKMTRAQGGDLQIITTMYGPPAWATKQRVIRGRDLDPAEKENVAMYMIHWAKYLIENEGFPVKYISLHNEGAQWITWDDDGYSKWLHSDYNLWWPIPQIVDFLKFMPPMMAEHGLTDVGLTNGEFCIWENKADRPYMFPDVAKGIKDDALAHKNLGLISNHGFAHDLSWVSSRGSNMLRSGRSDLHAWTTSKTVDPPIWWNEAGSVELIRSNIYDAKVNGLIPWAIIQSDPFSEVDPDLKPNWAGLNGENTAETENSPNWVGTAIWVDRKGGFQVLPGYYKLKQVYCAGQPGMAVANVQSDDSDIGLIAFAQNGTENPDAIVVNNIGKSSRAISVNVTGTENLTWDGFMTHPDGAKFYEPIGKVSLVSGKLNYTIPPKSTITFFATDTK